MAVRLSKPWTWQGTVGRAEFAFWGFGLAILKYVVDLALLGLMSPVSRPSMPWGYLLGTPLAPYVGPQNLGFSLLLLGLTLPFIYMGLALTMRRLRDATWSPLLVALFFAPFLNRLFFFFLCLAPTGNYRLRPDPASPPLRGFGWMNTETRVAAGSWAVGLTLAFAVPLVFFGATVLHDYGWALFIGVPFCVGLFATLIYSAGKPRSLPECLAVAWVACTVAACALLACAIEGAICIAMVIPIAMAIAGLGAFAGYLIQSARWSIVGTTKLYGIAWLGLPLLMVAEVREPATPELIAITTTCEIAAPPEVVWRHVVTFAELPPPHELLFRLGIAYPVRARITGQGVGALRRCEFSTGPFLEPITTWEDPRRLAFDVIAQPVPMKELSPYEALHPPHLDGFFSSRHGQFLLVPLPGGRTRLEGTTWYEQRLWPAAYWQMWSDALVHTIHRRVLDHIKREAEAAATLRP